MTREEIKEGLRFTVDMFKLDPLTGEERTLNDLDAKTVNACEEAIKVLEQEPNTWSLEDAREDFMHDVYNTLDFLPTNNEANQIIDSFDRVTCSIKQEPKKGYISIDDAMSVFDDFMCGEVDENGMETFFEMLKDKAESEGGVSE